MRGWEGRWSRGAVPTSHLAQGGAATGLQLGDDALTIPLEGGAACTIDFPAA